MWIVRHEKDDANVSCASPRRALVCVVRQNDVLPCVDDLLELIWQSRMQNAGITCGADYIFHEEVVSVEGRHGYVLATVPRD